MRAQGAAPTLGSLLCLLTNNTGPLCATTPTTVVDNTARANVDRWQSGNTNPANTAHVGTGGSLNLRFACAIGTFIRWCSPALGNVPDQTLGGNAGVNVDNTGVNLNRGGSVLGAVQGGECVCAHNIHTVLGGIVAADWVFTPITAMWVCRVDSNWASRTSPTFTIRPVGQLAKTDSPSVKTQARQEFSM